MHKKLLKIIALGLLSTCTLAAAQLPPIKPGMPGKKRGDIIAPMLDEQIAAWCDFSKQIIVTHTNILCAYVGDKTNPGAISYEKPPSKKKLAKSAPKDLSPNFYEMSEYNET